MTIFDPRKQLIIDGWNGGLTGGELAALHGGSRSSIMGILSRARDKGIKVAERTISQTARAIVARKGGLAKMHAASWSDKRKEKPQPGMPPIIVQAGEGVSHDTRHKLKRIRNLPSVIVLPDPPAQPSGGLWVGFMALDDRKGCRYADLDGKLFCNAPGFPYCAEHHAIVNPPAMQGWYGGKHAGNAQKFA